MRHKVLEMDDVKLVYSPLTIEQAEEYEEKAKVFSEEQDVRPELFKIAVCGLNNALTNGDAPWTVERLRKEMDLRLCMELWRAVLKESGYDLMPPGETRAQS